MDGSFDLPPEHVTNGQLFLLLQALNTKQSISNASQQRLVERIDKLDVDTKDMRDAWKAAGHLLTFIKYTAAVALAITGLWAITKNLWLTFWESFFS